jgi:hypothetical protein
MIAAGLTAWRLFSGYFTVNLSMKLKLDRSKPTTGGSQNLITTIILKKGSHSTATLEKLTVRVSLGGTEISSKFIDAVRIDDSRNLNLAPNETTRFASYCEVSADATYDVEVTLQGRRWRPPIILQLFSLAKQYNISWVENICLPAATAYWRATDVSYPKPPDARSAANSGEAH